MNKIFSVILSFLLFSSVTFAEDAIKQNAVDATETAEGELSDLNKDANDSVEKAAEREAGNEQTSEERANKEPADNEQVGKEQVSKEQVSKEQSAEEQAAKEQAKKDEASSKPWLPEAEKFDWLQLTSGEWLKGEIKSMYNERLEFDSDKLDLQFIEWEDVKYLKGYRASTVNIEYLEPVTGKLLVSDNTVTITNGDKAQAFDREALISFTPAGDREVDLWSIKLTLGLNVRSGNTDQLDYTSRLNVKRRTAKTRFVLDYLGNISKTGDGNKNLVEIVNNHRVDASHDIYTSRYFFYKPIFAEYFRDPFQNIDQRILAGVGVGYTIYDKGKLEWDVSGGPAYIRTKFVSVRPGEPEQVDGPALVFSTDVDAELSSTLDFIFKYNIIASKAESGGYTHHMIATFESEITGSLDFDISLIWDRISQQTTDIDGITPEPDDYRLVLGISYTY